MSYALIRDGAMVDTAEEIPAGSLQEPREGKAYWLPLVDVMPEEYDADSQALDAPAVEVGADQVTRTFTARARTADEWDTLRAQPLGRIEGEYQSRWQAPITYLDNTWDADQEAVNNIQGVVVLINSGVSIPDPRSWTPKDSLEPVSISHADLVGLGAAIAARKDALFIKKKTKQAEVAALTSVSALAAYDATTGWDE